MFAVVIFARRADLGMLATVKMTKAKRRAAGRKGGRKTFRKYGRAHMARIGRKGHRRSCGK